MWANAQRDGRPAEYMNDDVANNLDYWQFHFSIKYSDVTHSYVQS